MIVVYGLKNCDTCRKAQKWLTSKGLDHDFRDVRADGVGENELKRWNRAVGWETLLNRRSTTWKNLPPDDRDNVDESRAIALMLANPTLIKRPVIEHGDICTVGFGAEQQSLLTSQV
jgi:arsenate reductase